MTIYHSLLQFGFSDEDIKPDTERTNTRTVSLFRSDTPDGYPIVGLRYVCDFKAEEEWGIGDLAKAFASADNQTELIENNPQDSFISFNTSVMDDFDYKYSRFAEAEDYIKQNSSWVRYEVQDYKFRWMKIADLREYAKKHEIDIKGLRKKDDIVSRIISNAPLVNPNTYPGWFQNGKNLVFPKMEGVIGKTLDYLLHAAEHSNSLVVGSGKEVFASGLVIYNKDDIGPKLQAEIDEEQRFYDESMKKLEPVKKELKSRGHGWYALGSPSLLAPKGKEKPELHFWLNGYRKDKEYGGQPFGWYTLEELLSEKWIDDQKARDY